MLFQIWEEIFKKSFVRNDTKRRGKVRPWCRPVGYWGGRETGGRRPPPVCRQDSTTPSLLPKPLLIFWAASLLPGIHF